MKKKPQDVSDDAAGCIDILEQIVPCCIVKTKDEDGNLKKCIHVELLKQLISKDLTDAHEAYEFSWVGKKAAFVEANQPTSHLLSACPEESRDWDTTENVYIEGENLEALKLLQSEYRQKIKMIYIDPPYNTGNDFVYQDNFYSEIDGCVSKIGMADKIFSQKSANNELSARLHSRWCSMMYSRLMLARELLRDDGVIFISIDDHELKNLMHLCDEIFGERHFIGCISRATGTTTGQGAHRIGSSLDYCLAYAKSGQFVLNRIVLNAKDHRRFNRRDNRGRYSRLQLRKTGSADRREDRPNMFYPVTAPDGTDVYPVGPKDYLSRWRVKAETYQKLLQEGLIEWKKNNDEHISPVVDGYTRSVWTPYVKYYLKGRTKQVSNLFDDLEGNKKASLELKALLGVKGVFDNPKPVAFIERLIQIATDKNDLILDFFSGSATTAHAVMQYNARNKTRHRFILVQSPEVCHAKSAACKAGYATIWDIGRERLRRAGDRILKQYQGSEMLDVGFRVLKVIEGQND